MIIIKINEVVVMKIKLAIFSILYLSTTFSKATMAVDKIIINANIYTMESSQPWAKVLGIKNSTIVCIGDIGACDDFHTNKTEVIDLHGKFVLPGFIDSHNHISDNQGSKFLSVFGTTSQDQFSQSIQNYSNENPELKWIMGGGWNYSIFKDGMPSAKDLDGITAGRPAIFSSYDDHTKLLNTKAIELLGIIRTTKSSAVGEIKRDKQGNATGVFNSVETVSEEDQAHLDAILPKLDPEDVYQVFIKNLNYATTVGITTIVDPLVEPKTIDVFERARSEHHLNAHIRLALSYSTDLTTEQLQSYKALREKYSNDLQIQVPAVKLFIDDVIEAETAALFEPYVGTNNIGSLFFEVEQYNEIITNLDNLGFQVFVHAIGDRGVRIALDAFEVALNKNGKPKLPHQLVHVELLKPSDAPRFKTLDVSAAMQPRHLSPNITDQWAKSVGKKRHKNAWPLKTLQNAGARFAFSSDWNVAEMDPLIGIYTAVTRQSLTGHPKGGWEPQERLDLHSALKGYTLSGAVSNGIERERGSLKIGKIADVIVLSDNLFTIEPSKIKDAQVIKTYFEGEKVFDRYLNK
jgi:predicted amidohydrolase YtcJ